MVAMEKSQVKGPGYTAKLFIVNYDDVILRGRYYLPQDKQKKYPTVILSHEFGLSMASTGRYAKRIAKAGFCVFIYDFAGSGAGSSRGRASTDMTVLTEVEDLAHVFEYVSEQEFVDTSRIYIGGASQGGFVSALFAAQNESKVKALIMYYPALCIPDDARSGNIIGTKIDPKNIPDEFMAMVYVKLGRKYVEVAQKLDPWEEICSFKKPVLLIHGSEDRLVNVKYAREAAGRYPDCKYIEIEGADHCFVKLSTTIKAAMETIKFMKGQN